MVTNAKRKTNRSKPIKTFTGKYNVTGQNRVNYLLCQNDKFVL